MQRRAAAAYVVFFVLIAAGSYAFIATAQAPSVTIDNPDHELSPGSTFQVDGRTYTVAELKETESGGGGHGGGGTTLEGSLSWTNDSAIYTESFDNGGSVDISNTTYDVLIPNETSPDSATLREQPGDDVETVDRGNTTYVVVDQNDDGTDELIPIDEYEPLKRIELSQGQNYEYKGNQTTVQITNTSLAFQWTGSKTNSVSLTNEGNVTLNGKTFLVFIESPNKAYLTSDYQSYNEQVESVDYFHERMEGFWGVTLLSGLAAILLTGLAYLPHKDT